MLDRDVATTELSQDGVPRGWRRYSLPGGLPLLTVLVPLVVLVLLFLQLTGRLADGPDAQERAQETAESIATVVGAPAGSRESSTRSIDCAGGQGQSSEHVLAMPARDSVQQTVTDLLDYFTLSGWGNARYLADDARAVRGVRGDQAALVTVTDAAVRIEVVAGPCAAAVLPEPSAPYTRG
jgi:hypothetical protein